MIPSFSDGTESSGVLILVVVVVDDVDELRVDAAVDAAVAVAVVVVVAVGGAELVGALEADVVEIYGERQHWWAC